ncbi:MAG: LysR family transcriptional regulator [Saccharospirillaceae bacterium]|nr:LysR family transcriptional regulator [Colwellia sp.]NRB77302.1 LysR family transcriptional regulator [Saccharospirillaceae bacterium]
MARNLRNVDLNLLSIFAALMRDKNLSHTAENLAMTQPAVSQALKRLRSLYNDPLFERKGGKMMPTLKAEEIYPTVNQVLSDISSIMPESDKFYPEDSTLTFHINILGIDNRHFIGKIVETIRNKAPGISLKISTDNLFDAEKSLRDREYDLHIDYMKVESAGCHSEILFEDYLYIIAKHNHPQFGDKKSLLMSDYLSEEHAVLAPRKDNIYPLNHALTFFTGKRNIKYTGSSIQNVIEIVGMTDYICTMPSMVLKSMHNVGDYIWFLPPFKTPEITASMNWHWAIEHHQSHKWLRNEIVNICSTMTPLVNMQNNKT